MTTPMTPLEVVENEACAKIAERFADHFRGREGHGATVQVAEEIAGSIRDRVGVRGVEPDPFTKCLYQGCAEEALGAFCAGHLVFVPHHVQRELAQAIVEDDHKAYGLAVARARREIDAGEVAAAAAWRARQESRAGR